MSDVIERFKAKQRAQERLCCRHRVAAINVNGPDPTHCEAGVPLAPLGPVFKRPCMNGGAGCTRFSALTEEEMDAKEREITELLGRTTKARSKIVEATGGKRRVSGSIPCPVCKKSELSYSVASNGHIHAACRTAGCVRWME
jgi:hypothetical protein